MNEYVYEYESEYVDMKWMNEYHRLKKYYTYIIPLGFSEIRISTGIICIYLYYIFDIIAYIYIYIYIISYFYIEKTSTVYIYTMK